MIEPDYELKKVKGDSRRKSAVLAPEREVFSDRAEEDVEPSAQEQPAPLAASPLPPCHLLAASLPPPCPPPCRVLASSTAPALPPLTLALLPLPPFCSSTALSSATALIRSSPTAGTSPR